MAANIMSQKVFQPKPPIQGVFPLDHEGECKKEMLYYLLCLNRANNDNSKCKCEARDYLACRMSKNLMEKHNLEDFGYKDVDDKTKVDK